MNWRGTSHQPIEEIVWTWEGEAHVVLFDPATGDPHLLSSLAGLLLELLDRRSSDFESLLREVRGTLDTDSPPPSGLPGLVQEHLHRLARLGLLQEIPA